MAQTIPVLDLQQFTSPGGEASFAQQVGDALADTGFFALENHGVDRDLISRAYAAADAFFSQPEEEKLKYEHLELKGQRGFTRFGREKAKDHAAADLKEFWHVGRDLPAGHPMTAVNPPNVWPDFPPDFHPAFRDLYQALDRCAMTLLEAVSLYIGEPRNLLADAVRDGTTILRIIHYPPIPKGAPGQSMRAAPHEDINLITLLCEATAGGLELLNRQGEWIPIEAVSGQIVVDAGDMLQNITNGLLRSTTHRVVNPGNSRERRFSMPFFAHPRPEVPLDPLPGCVDRTGGELRYPRWTAGEYLAQRLKEIGLA
jgi:isopenicillin N synthase-like dioxygenase